jgi:integrase
MLLTLGVNPRVVMEIAGHAALEMTMNAYGHTLHSMTSARHGTG